MPRKEKTRRIENPPPVSVFKPAGVPARGLARVTLRLDEYEALRLADYEGLMQEDVAERLGVSRPTVSRVLEKARRTVAAAFVEGKALFIEGGPVQFGPPWANGRHGGGRRHGRGANGPPQFGIQTEKGGVEMAGGRGGGAGAGPRRGGRGRMGGTSAGPGGTASAQVVVTRRPTKEVCRASRPSAPNAERG